MKALVLKNRNFYCILPYSKDKKVVAFMSKQARQIHKKELAYAKATVKEVNPPFQYGVLYRRDF